MRACCWLFAIALAACGTDNQWGDGEVVLANSAAVVPANEAHGTVSASFATGLEGKVCSAWGSCFSPTRCQGGEPANHYSAGAITIGPGPITLEPDATRLYGSAGVADGRIVAPNTPLTVHAAGDQIPAFDLSVTSPEPLTVLAPARTLSDVTRTNDLAIAWSGLTMGSVSVHIVDSSNSAIECTFPGVDGAGTVPADALAVLTRSQGTLTINATTSARATVGMWTVTFEVVDDAAWADGSSGELALTLHD